MMKPEKRLPTTVKRNILNMPYTFCFIMFPIMSGLPIMARGLALATFLLRYPYFSLQ
jgi:hypothetical protein